ncbi:uncharacterized protein SPSK_03307 [Sporothrix schenckii 1099-18]|uniref:Uncharacterized protein n=2 Tax=Sporothrix schenckii TaxID=29908 RepID=U7PXP2_SPOS1|nr:uncharacterized protein SPSK_03307 [Sporothrix schenckii 1099-18]ERS99499.1 hypothetical protein HMPREF1624_04700 [Sporothrix schenckii ATCC 58251]KJR82769.1 hypothetical protein SPSK_03307 [Sporothrix schenckii 1099-18]
MGLHVTPYGTFYVQRSLRTGEVMQVLPVKRPDMPSHLPSVDSLGITENFIESRRASLAADTARAEDSQGRLQQELATAGGESLLATGKAVLAQNGGSGGDSGGNRSSNAHSSPLAPNYDGDVEMAYGSSTSGSARGAPTSPVSYPHSATRQRRSSSHRSSNTNYVLSEDTHQQPSSMAMAPHMLPVRPWPNALHQEATVNLPPFREIDSARALTHEEELRHEEQVSSRGGGRSSRSKSTASPRMASVLRSSSRNCSRSNSTSHGHGYRNGHHSNSNSNNNAFSISNMISHGSEGSASSVYSVSEVSTPSGPVSPGPDYYYCNSNDGYSPATTYAAASPAASFGGNSGCSMMVDESASPQVPAPVRRSSQSSTPRAGRGHRTGTSPSPGQAPARVLGPYGPSAATYAPPVPNAAPPLPPSPLAAAEAAPLKKNKTVWIIRTLEPRKVASRRTADGADDYEPQRVQTHVETHIVP